MAIYVIAEQGLSAAGDLNVAKELIKVAKDAGADCVKFQKRTLPDCVPEHQRFKPKDTPWGEMCYLEYRQRMEFTGDDYHEIDSFSKKLGIPWTASVWDIKAASFLREFDVPFFKIPSAKITNLGLLEHVNNFNRPVVLSTGMSTMDEIDCAVEILRKNLMGILHCTSTYPADHKEINLRVINTFRKRYPGIKIGYSGHELGLQVSTAAAALGAEIIERHYCRDRTDFPKDCAASLEPQGLKKLIRDIRIVEKVMGDGVKRVYDSELPIMKKLRG